MAGRWITYCLLWMIYYFFIKPIIYYGIFKQLTITDYNIRIYYNF